VRSSGKGAEKGVTWLWNLEFVVVSCTEKVAGVVSDSMEWYRVELSE